MTEGWEDNDFMKFGFDALDRLPTGQTWDNEEHLYSNC